MGLEKLNPKPAKSQRVLCLWLPNWPIQRLVVALPEHRKQRVVLFSQDARRRQMVVAASPLAQMEGVQVDTPLTEAKALLSRAAQKFRKQQSCDRKPAQARPTQARPNVQKPAAHPVGTETADQQPFFRIFQHVPQDDHEALQALAAELDSYSPIVGLQQGVEQPDCIFLDISGLATLFGSETQLANELVRFCESQGYLVRVGIAHTLGLAQAIAQHLTSQPSNVVSFSRERCQKIIQRSSEPGTDSGLSGDLKLSSGLECPDIGEVASPAELHGWDELPIESLRLKRELTQTLGQLGIFRIGQLLNVPRKELYSRFGNEIYIRLDQLTGKRDEPIQACPRPREFHAEQLLDHPTNHKETIEVILERLIQKICQQLRSVQQGALQWTIRLYGQQKLPIKMQVRLFAPTTQADQVVQLARMQLEQVLQPELFRRKKKLSKPGLESRPTSSKKDQWIQRDGRPIDVNEIAVTVTSSVLMENRQRELFDESPRADKQALAHLINRLSGRLGYRNVVVPQMVSGNQPEYSYLLKPLVHTASRQNRTTQAPLTPSHVVARPVRLFHPPQPVEVVALSPRRDPETGRNPGLGFDRCSEPVAIVLHNRRVKISQTWGPERIETGWWRGNLVRRDYWKVEVQSNLQYWIYFDLREQRWYLQGEF